MSRKISIEAAQAFHSGTPFSKSNTHVRVMEDGRVTLLLFNNIIAVRNGNALSVTLAGWPTAATRERLNALDGVTARQKDGCQYINGLPVSDHSMVLI